MKNVFACLMIVALTPIVWAEDKTIENPAYATWAKHKVGTSVTQKISSEAGGIKSEATTTYKLLEVKPDKVILEATTKSKSNGKEFESPAEKMEIVKTMKVAAMPMPKEPMPEPKKPEGETTSGEETLKISGRDYKTKWSKHKGKQGDNEYETQTWMSDDVPNQIVKSVTKNTNKDPKLNYTSVIEVTEIKIP